MPITRTPRPSPCKFPRRSLAEIAEDLSRDAEDLSRRRRESLHGSLAENAEMQGWFVSTLLRSLREIFHGSHMSSLRLGARCSASPREIRRHEFLAALSQTSLKISRRDAEDLSRRRRESLQGSLAENAEMAGLVCFCSLALSARDLPRFLHQFS